MWRGTRSRPELDASNTAIEQLDGRWTRWAVGGGRSFAGIFCPSALQTKLSFAYVGGIKPRRVIQVARMQDGLLFSRSRATYMQQIPGCLSSPRWGTQTRSSDVAQNDWIPPIAAQAHEEVSCRLCDGPWAMDGGVLWRRAHASTHREGMDGAGSATTTLIGKKEKRRKKSVSQCRPSGVDGGEASKGGRLDRKEHDTIRHNTCHQKKS